uniref:Sorting nexin C-terminal domain-containing protein n=1 Tax=Callorhinchus milii TaxID=7868 RepID=A0A4W3HWG0_CALMI
AKQGGSVLILAEVDVQTFTQSCKSKPGGWLEVQIANLTCTQHWVVYLRLLQEAIWPGGTLPKWPKPVRSQEQKQQTQEQAYQSLMKLLPALVPEVLGEEGYRKSWRHILDSLQNPLINRHLVYCICDLLLEFLIPEASSEEFQRSLLSCVSGSVERVPN